MRAIIGIVCLGVGLATGILSADKRGRMELVLIVISVVALTAGLVALEIP